MTPSLRAPMIVAGARPTPPSAARREDRRYLLALGAVAVLALGHAALVGLRYHVGSFDDDGHYVLLARALAHGLGYVDTSVLGAPPEATVPPGYPGLLALLAVLFPHSTIAFRALSAACWLALFPLLWYWLRCIRIGPGARLAMLLLLALSPLAATYATMVMAEMPFLVLLLVLLIAMHHWDRQAKVSTGWAWAVLAALVALVYIKAAGAAFVPGVGVYLLVRHGRRRAAFGVGIAVLGLAPLVLSRLALGVPLVGKRYAGDYGGSYHGLGETIVSSLHAIGHYATTALPSSVLPVHGLTAFGDAPIVTGALSAVYYSVTPLVIAGFVAWQVRRPDVSAALVPIYLLETLPFPFINERRVVLILPLVLVWYVGGLALLGRLIALGWTALRRSATTAAPGHRPALLALSAVLVVPALGAQFGRDYLLPPGADTSQPAGSPYLAIMAAAASPGAVFASSYRWTTSAFTGHPTDAGLFADIGCNLADPPADYEHRVRERIARQHIGFVLTAALNKHDRVDDPCLGLLLIAHPEYAPLLYQQETDHASVFELVGPNTPHPNLRALTVGRPVVTTPTSVTMAFAGTARVEQVSLGAAGMSDGRTDAARIELRRPGGRWVTVASAAGAVGPSAPGGPAYLLRTLDPPVTATAVRVAVLGTGAPQVSNLHVLGVPEGAG